jgi:hypothetical protein
MKISAPLQSTLYKWRRTGKYLSTDEGKNTALMAASLLRIKLY